MENLFVFTVPFGILCMIFLTPKIAQMPFAYKQVELQKMEWCSRDTLYKHLDKFVPIYINKGKRVSKRYLSREDSLIFKAGLDVTRDKRCLAFCETAFDTEFTGEIPATALCIIAHYDDGRVYDKIIFQWNDVIKLNKITGLTKLLKQLTVKCYPPKDRAKYYIQEFDERDLELFNFEIKKKGRYRKKSHIMIDWFGKKRR